MPDRRVTQRLYTATDLANPSEEDRGHEHRCPLLLGAHPYGRFSGITPHNRTVRNGSDLADKAIGGLAAGLGGWGWVESYRTGLEASDGDCRNSVSRQKKGRASGTRPFSCGYRFGYATEKRDSLFLRRVANPIPAKPTIIMAHVAGSGTAGAPSACQKLMCETTG